MIALSLRALALAAAGLSLVSAGCAVMRGQQTMGTYIDDRTITASVKARLAQDPTASAMAVDVDTQEGVVTLSGFAKTSAEKSQAETLARGVQGVKSVRNILVVRP